MRYRGVPPRTEIERTHPFAVVITVPPGGLGLRLDALNDAAKAAGEHRTVGMLRGLEDAVAYRFKTEAAAAQFRAAAVVIAAELVRAVLPTKC